MSGAALALDAAVTGAGISAVGRKLERSALSLSIEACLAALADADLARADIDGVSTYPGSSPSTFEVVDGLGLAVNWHDGGDGGQVTLRALFNAFLAVSTGWANHVLVYRTVVRNAPAGHAGGSSGTVGGPDLWSRTSLRPGDVDVAQLYDGYSVMVLEWLEALGFCERGEVGPLVDSGAIALDGRIPVNTGGGMLSAGRLHGFLPVYEACLQLWGEAGERQIPGAEVAVATNGAGPYAGCLLLRRAE